MQALRVIGEEHRNLWRIVTTMDGVADAIVAGAAVDAAFFTAVFDYLEQFVDRMHHRKEDDFLFPALRKRSPAAAEVLDRLQAEHRDGQHELAVLRERLRTAAREEFVVAVHRYTSALKAHIRTEEKDVMLLARETLSADDWSVIDAAFLDHRDPVFGEQAQAEFRELYHRIASLAPDSVGLGAQTGGALQPGAAAPRGEVLMAIDGLESAYGRIKALKGVSLEIRAGELVALVGTNGAGKTTLLRAISGVQTINAGRIRYAGEDITRLRPDRRVRLGICQVPEGRQVFGPLSIEDNLRLGAYTRLKAEAEADLERIYAMFPVLHEKRRLPAGTLSGGQQQMLAIGRALMGRPRLLLLDEPSMGLAPLLVEEVFNVIKTLKQQGTTIFLVEQNAHAALAVADRGYVLETGSVTLTGTGAQLLGNEQVRAAYLGM